MLQGHYQDSLNLLSVELPAPLHGTDIEAWQRLTQSMACAFLPRLDDARTHLAEARKIIDLSQHQLLGEWTLRQGTLEFLADHPQLAWNSYKATRDLALSSHDPYLEAAALGSLGLVSTRLERYDESIDWNTLALQRSRQISAINSIARIEGNTGWSYHEMGDFPSALQQFRAAAEDARKAGLSADRAYWINSQAGALFDLHDYNAADVAARDASNLALELHDTGTLIECLQTEALVYTARRQWNEAASALREAARLGQSTPLLNRDLYTSLLLANLAIAQSQFAEAEKLYRTVVAAKEAYTSLRWEALAGLAQVHAQQRRSALAEREFAQAIDTISGARNSIAREEFRLSFLSSAIHFYDQYVDFFLSQNRPLDALRIADRSRAQTLEHGLSLTAAENGKSFALSSFDPMAVARRQKATLLFYWTGETRSLLWAITPRQVALFRLPARDEIDSATAAYRRSFLDPRDPLESGNAYGPRLYDLLVRPAEKLLPEDSRVVILPDGSLTGLNFETLINPTPRPHYWIEDVTVSIANSLSLLSRTRREPPPTSSNMLFFGSAIPASKEFPALPDSSLEQDAVVRHFAVLQRTLFTGSQATAPNYLAGNPGRYSYIHFATHGIASTVRPLESALILSEDHGAFKLYARDIVGRPLNAYLVTISACNGAGERVLEGEGLVGLSWAFLRAGAHNVVAGLWEVSTASTRPIFDRLYDGVTHGEDPATALRNAKLALLRSKGPERRPFYWAPFQLYSGS